MKVFESKIDNWIALLIFIAAVMSFYEAISMVLSFHFWQFLTGVCIFIFCVVMPFWIILFTRYSLSDTKLNIICGPFRWTIPCEEVASVSEVRSFFSAPALSVDRLKIVYADGKSIVISPGEKDAFLKAITQ